MFFTSLMSGRRGITRAGAVFLSISCGGWCYCWLWQYPLHSPLDVGHQKTRDKRRSVVDVRYKPFVEVKFISHFRRILTTVTPAATLLNTATVISMTNCAHLYSKDNCCTLQHGHDIIQNTVKHRNINTILLLTSLMLSYVNLVISHLLFS